MKRKTPVNSTGKMKLSEILSLRDTFGEQYRKQIERAIEEDVVYENDFCLEAIQHSVSLFYKTILAAHQSLNFIPPEVDKLMREIAQMASCLGAEVWGLAQLLHEYHEKELIKLARSN